MKNDSDWIMTGSRSESAEGPSEFKPFEFYYGETNAKGERHGIGTLIVKGSGIYEGRWERGSLTGQGRVIYENGDSYSGLFRKGIKHGRGSYT